MSYFASTIDPIQSAWLPNIPDYYSKLKKGSCIFLCLWEDETREKYLGCIVASFSAVNPSHAYVKYIQIEEGEVKEKIFISLVFNLRSELLPRGIDRLYFSVCMIEGATDGILTMDMISRIACRQVDEEEFFTGYFVQDICDSAFMVWRYKKMEEDLHSRHFYEFSDAKCALFLKKLENPSATPESPYGRFYLADNKPIGGLCMEQPDDNTIVISVFADKNRKKRASIYAAILAGALSDALYEHGLDFRVFFRLKSQEDVSIIEKYLGESTIPVEYKSYYIPICE